MYYGIYALRSHCVRSVQSGLSRGALAGERLRCKRVKALSEAFLCNALEQPIYYQEGNRLK